MRITKHALMGVFVLASIVSVNGQELVADEPPNTKLAELKPATEQQLIAEVLDVETLSVKLTSYNAVPAQTDSTPNITASGLRTNPEVIAAVSPDMKGSLPFGTVIRVSSASTYDEPSSCGLSYVEEKLGYRVVADVTHARKKEQIDILLDHNDPISFHGKSMNPSLVLGICDGVQIEVVGKIALSDVPETQQELAALID